MSVAELIPSIPVAALKGMYRAVLTGIRVRAMFSSTNAQTSRIETAAALWRRIMPTPRPSTGASVVSRSPHSRGRCHPRRVALRESAQDGSTETTDHPEDPHRQSEARRDGRLGRDGHPSGRLRRNCGRHGSVLSLGGEHQRAHDRREDGGEPCREDECQTDREREIRVRIDLDEGGQDPRQRDADDRGQCEDRHVRAER